MRGGRNLVSQSGASVRRRAGRKRHFPLLRRRRPRKSRNNRYDVTNRGLERSDDGVGGSDVRRPSVAPVLFRVLAEELPSREQAVRVQQLVRLMM